MPMLAAAAHLCCVCLWSGFRSPGPSPVYMCAYVLTWRVCARLDRDGRECDIMVRKIM